MPIYDSLPRKSHPFEVRIINRSIVKASNLSRESYLQSVFNFDLIPARNPTALVYIYPKPAAANLGSIMLRIRQCLPYFLDYYFPFAGRIMTNASTQRLEITCNNEGAELLEAEADVPLSSINFGDTKKSLEVIMVPFPAEIPLSLQVIRFACGGFSLTWCSNHQLVDAYSLSRLSCSWAELVQTNKILRTPNFDRSLFQPRFLLRYDSSMDRNFTTCEHDSLINALSGRLFHRGAYHVMAADLDRLRALASQSGLRATRMQAFSAHVWKIFAEVVGESDSTCRMGWIIDGRQIMGRPNGVAMECYIGNMHSICAKEASVRDLRERTVSDVASIVASAIKEVSTEEHFRDVVDWVEYHDKDFMLHKVQLGVGSPSILISACHSFPMQADFGFGQASLAVFHSKGSDRLGTGYMNVASSPTGDGSWTVKVALWPQVVAALQADNLCGFRTITAESLGLLESRAEKGLSRL